MTYACPATLDEDVRLLGDGEAKMPGRPELDADDGVSPRDPFFRRRCQSRIECVMARHRMRCAPSHRASVAAIPRPASSNDTTPSGLAHAVATTASAARVDGGRRQIPSAARNRTRRHQPPARSRIHRPLRCSAARSVATMVRIRLEDNRRRQSVACRTLIHYGRVIIPNSSLQ